MATSSKLKSTKVSQFDNKPVKMSAGKSSNVLSIDVLAVFMQDSVSLMDSVAMTGFCVKPPSMGLGPKSICILDLCQ